LPGIGPSKALAIIEYRDTNGGFQSVDDIKKISGIGEKTFEKLEPHISIK
jgi:competence protein ComEA